MEWQDPSCLLSCTRLVLRYTVLIMNTSFSRPVVVSSATFFDTVYNLSFNQLPASNYFLLSVYRTAP